MYLLYSLFLTLGALVSAPYWVIKGLRQKKYLQNVGQRFGFSLPLCPIPGEPLWMHAVSVGEILAAKTLFAALRKSRPDLPIIISTVTQTGQALARKELADAAAIFYFPFDWDFAVARFLDTFKPRGIVLLETELWPNFLKACSRRKIPILLLNGRISDKSIARYRRLGKFTRAMIRNVTAIGAQSEEDMRRFTALGAKPEQAGVTGNLKFDFLAGGADPDDEFLQCICSLMEMDQNSPVLVMGSTMKGEEAPLLDCYRKVREAIPGTRLILAPRHPERFDEVADLLRMSGICFQRRSCGMPVNGARSDVLLLDTIGELRSIYQLASVAIIGGTFLPPFGGHNPLEPAALGKAVVFGPRMSNFKEIARLLLQNAAARQCALEALHEVLIELLQDAHARIQLGLSAARTLEQNGGATARTMELLNTHVH